jgi:predicted Fe-Mo cluster-binding NifX family protein
MKIAIPIEEYRGLESTVYGHFGSAPSFAFVDSETMSVQTMENPDSNHEHGTCSPLRALAGANPDAILVNGIGAGAVMGLRQAGIGVWLAPAGTVADVVRLFKEGKLEEIADRSTCHCSS